MRKVDAMHSEEEIRQMSQYLRKQSLRDYLLFRLGINLGLRVSELLTLKIEDIKGRERLVIQNTKQNRSYEFILSESLQSEINFFVGDQEEGLLFRSRNNGGALTRQRAYLILRKAAENAGLDRSIGTHTLRKTFGYWAYKKGTSLESIRYFFGHATIGVTMKYLGLERGEAERTTLFAPLDI